MIKILYHMVLISYTHLVAFCYTWYTAKEKDDERKTARLSKEIHKEGLEDSRPNRYIGSACQEKATQHRGCYRSACPGNNPGADLHLLAAQRQGCLSNLYTGKGSDQIRRPTMYLIELILGWLIGKRNGGEYFFMRGAEDAFDQENITRQNEG